MAYNKQTWDTASYVNPTRMNHIEAGIEANSNSVEELEQGAAGMSGEIEELKQNIADLQNYDDEVIIGKIGNENLYRKYIKILFNPNDTTSYASLVYPHNIPNIKQIYSENIGIESPNGGFYNLPYFDGNGVLGTCTTQIDKTNIGIRNKSRWSGSTYYLSGTVTYTKTS